MQMALRCNHSFGSNCKVGDAALCRHGTRSKKTFRLTLSALAACLADKSDGDDQESAGRPERAHPSTWKIHQTVSASRSERGDGV